MQYGNICASRADRHGQLQRAFGNHAQSDGSGFLCFLLLGLFLNLGLLILLDFFAHGLFLLVF